MVRTSLINPNSDNTSDHLPFLKTSENQRPWVETRLAWLIWVETISRSTRTIYSRKTFKYSSFLGYEWVFLRKINSRLDHKYLRSFIGTLDMCSIFVHRHKKFKQAFTCSNSVRETAKYTVIDIILTLLFLTLGRMFTLFFCSHCWLWTSKYRLCMLFMLSFVQVNVIQKQSPEVFCKKEVFKNFAKFTGKHLCQNLFFDKIKRLWHGCFPVNFAKILRTLSYWTPLDDCYCNPWIQS